MANEELDEIYDDEMEGEEFEDTAAGLTSGLVITTTVLLLVAMFIMFKALGDQYGVGPMKG